MPIWIKSGNSLWVCSGFEIFKSSGKYRICFYSVVTADECCMKIDDLTESQAQDLMRDITRAVASGDRYFEIPERCTQNERT